MGGSDRKGFGHLDRRPFTTDFLPLDVRALAKLLDFRFSCDVTCTWAVHGEAVGTAAMTAGAGVMVLRYQFVGPEKVRLNVTTSVPLVWSRCTLGGNRPWFLCPGERCGRRVAILYCGADLLCRRCLGLAYPSQWEPAPVRAYRRAGRIRHRLEGRGGSISCFPPVRPKGMHHQTFYRLQAEHDQWMALYFTDETKRIEVMLKRIGSMEGWLN